MDFCISRRRLAEIRVIRMPYLHPDAVRIEVDCRFSTTGITQLPAPGGLELPTPALITAATFEHEARCGECDTAEAHAQGARELREETERAYEAMRERRLRYYAHGRRN
jgi:hypothetical protein